MDLGDKNIGVAISDQGLKFANPLKVIKQINNTLNDNMYVEITIKKYRKRIIYLIEFMDIIINY